MRKAAVIVIAALAVVAGCGTTNERRAASVNDVVITDDAVIAELKAIAANTDFVSQIEASGSKVNGATEGTFDPTFAAQVLVNQMGNELVRQEVVRRGLTVSDDCVAKARHDTFVDLGNGTASDGEALFNKFSTDYQVGIVRRRADVLALQNDLVHQVCGSPDVAATYYNNHQDQFASTCLSLISVADDATATDVVNRARAGEDFAALAQQYSTDESKANGGDIGCHFPSALPDTLAAAVVSTNAGDVMDPITTAVGPAIFKVGAKNVAPFDEVEQQALELADGDLVKEFRACLQAAEGEADVDVDPRFGTFDPKTFVITPPGSGTTTSTTVAPPPTSSPPP